MTKTFIFAVLAFIILRVVLGVISQQCPYGRCASYVEHIGDELCKYRNDRGEWPKDMAEIAAQGILEKGEKLETLYGVPLEYNPTECTLTAECPHKGIPLLSWIKFTGYYSGCNSHGISLTNRYEQLYGE
jgi:hypothetical protein